MPTPKEIHDYAVADAGRLGCVCSGPKPERLCMDPKPPDGSLSCTRAAPHYGPHVACAGSAGPHGVASWMRESELDPLMLATLEARQKKATDS